MANSLPFRCRFLRGYLEKWESELAVLFWLEEAVGERI
jgi:hypothetical protein